MVAAGAPSAAQRALHAGGGVRRALPHRLPRPRAQGTREEGGEGAHPWRQWRRGAGRRAVGQEQGALCGETLSASGDKGVASCPMRKRVCKSFFSRFNTHDALRVLRLQVGSAGTAEGEKLVKQFGADEVRRSHPFSLPPMVPSP